MTVAYLSKDQALERVGQRTHPNWSSACILDAMGSKLAYADRNSMTAATSDGMLAIDEATMSAGFVISTTRRDHMGDLVVSRGCLSTLNDYINNPVVFFSHRSDEAPVALAKNPQTGEVALWVEDDQILSRAYFHGRTRESAETFDLVAAGILRAASIGFSPIEIEVMDLAYPEIVPGEPFRSDDIKGLIFHQWSLLEWSVVPVPANADALRGHLDSGRVKSVMLRKSLEMAAAQPKGQLFIDARALVDDRVAPPHNSGQVQADGPVDSSGRPQLGDKAEQPQAVLFAKSRFDSEAEVKAWLDENQLKSTKIEFAEESNPDAGPGSWVSIQFPADLCIPETVRHQEVEDGVTLVFCKLAPNEPKPEDQKVMSEVVEKELDTPVPGNQQVAGMEPAIISPSSGVKAEEPPDMRPHGCKMLHTVKSHLCAMKDYIQDAAPMLEHPKVAKMISKIHDQAHELHKSIHELGKEVYPDHFPDAGEDVPNDAHKSYADILVKAGLAPDEFDIADMGFLLTEMSGVKGLLPSQRIACAKMAEQITRYRVVVKHSVLDLPGVEIPVATPTPAVVTVPLAKGADLSAAEEKLLKEKLESLTRKLYELTGEEI